MAIDRKKFFDGIRGNPFAGHISEGQFDGLTRILDEWERRKLTDTRWLSYILATAFHETGQTMQPVREGGGEAYLRGKDYYPWVGEGLVQVTWEVNHRKFGATAPGQLMTWPIALKALFDGMIKGMFTTKKLSDYFNSQTTDWINARRIVNGTDRAAVIASYARAFHAAILAAEVAPTKKVSTAVTTGAGAIVAGTAAAAGGSTWVDPHLWPWAIAGGVVLLILLALLTSMKKPPAAAPKVSGPLPAPIPPVSYPGNAPAAGDPASRLEAGFANLQRAGAAWDAAREQIAKATADMRVEAEVRLATVSQVVERIAAIEAPPVTPPPAPSPIPPADVASAPTPGEAA